MNGFKADRTGDSVRIDMGASLENIDRAAALLEELARDRYPGLNLFGLLLGFREALGNAVIHGNLGDHKKSVRCRVGFGVNDLAIEVCDEGDGFDWRTAGIEIPSPLSPGKRGIAIIKNYFDECIYNEKGNKILLTKRKLC